jgi:hypothetical protein
MASQDKDTTSFEYDDADDDEKAVEGAGSDIDKKKDPPAAGLWATDGADSEINNKEDPLAGGPWADEEETTKPQTSQGQEGQQRPVSAIATAQEATIPVVVDVARVSTTGDVRAAQEELRVQAAERRAADAQAAEDRLADSNRPLVARLRRWIVSLPRKQWLVLLSLLVMLLCAALALIGVCESGRSTVMCSRPPPAPPAPPPPVAADPADDNLSPRASFILSYINNITLTGQTLKYPDASTPEGRALAWLIDDDVGTTEMDLVSLRQRYALTTLLFQMPSGVGGVDGDNSKTWGTAMNVCQWRNVTCDDTDRPVRNVEALQLESTLEGIRVEGQIPPDLGLLTSLRRLELSATRLGGTIPSSLGRLTSLLTLLLPNNALTGTIPSSIGSLTSLIELWLSYNDLNGTIPSSLGSLTSLDALYISYTALSGTIPSSIVRMKSLTVLDLQINTLTGTIPPSMGDLTSLKTLLLDRNRLNGTIPSSLGSLTALNEDLTLGGNQLIGTIPSALGALTSLLRLDLFGNALTGTIPEALASMTSLQALVVNNNNLTGTIPLSLASLTSLTALWLQNNALTGAFPSSLVSLTSLNDLTLYNNNITGSIPFCDFEYLEADCNEVDCPCCKYCCPTGGWNGIPEIPKARKTRCDS